MKRVSMIVSFFLLISCNSSQEKTEKSTKANFDFLIGNWKEINRSEGEQTFENWKKVNDSLYAGHSYTLVNKDTVWQEFVKLSPIGDEWFYQVEIPSENQSTNFRLTEHNDSLFMCENPENEFPKKIAYWKKSTDKLLAEISDDTNKIQFHFERL